MKFILSNGVEIPAVGYGTYLATAGQGEKAIQEALDCGYRYFDTASFYKNEEEIGNVLAQSGIERGELFLTSKVWRDEMGYDQTKQAFERSLSRLQTDYLDLYLIHWPKQSPDADNWEKTIQDTWRAMEELYQEGKVRAIGLSNFLPHHIEVLLQDATVKPMANQLELHVGYMQEMAVRYCQENGIVLQAWSPLGRNKLLSEPAIQKMADSYKVTAAQLLLRYLLQREIIVIPKASARERMLMNRNIPEFTIRERDMHFLNCLPPMGFSGEHPDVI